MFWHDCSGVFGDRKDAKYVLGGIGRFLKESLSDSGVTCKILSVLKPPKAQSLTYYHVPGKLEEARTRKKGKKLSH
jgi:hypothetical protein